MFSFVAIALVTASKREALDHVGGSYPILARDEVDKFSQDPSERFLRKVFVQGFGMVC